MKICRDNFFLRIKGKLLILAYFASLSVGFETIVQLVVVVLSQIYIDGNIMQLKTLIYNYYS